MSSILEALKKLEAEKTDQFPDDIPPDEVPDYSSTTLAEGPSPRPPAPAGTHALLWVLGGGMFTLMVIGVAVLLVMLLLQRNQTAPPPTSPLAAVAPNTSLPSKATPPPSEPLVGDTAVSTPPSPPTPRDGLPVVAAATKEPPTTGVRPKTPEPKRPRVAQQPSPRPQPIAKPPATRVSAPTQRTAVSVASTAPLPKDIRSLPMLSRNEKSQYRLESVQLNMLNVAGPTRPLGNAFINLEKVFIGEFLPGTSARLIDVKGHGIAIEIQSTRQRYYIPR
jgi:hypothetical protein